MYNATFNNISVISRRSVLFVEEIGVPRENHRPVANHWQTWSHNDLLSTLAGSELIALMLTCTDCIGSCKSNYHTNTVTTIPFFKLVIKRKVVYLYSF